MPNFLNFSCLKFSKILKEMFLLSKFLLTSPIQEKFNFFLLHTIHSQENFYGHNFCLMSDLWHFRLFFKRLQGPLFFFLEASNGM